MRRLYLKLISVTLMLFSPTIYGAAYDVPNPIPLSQFDIERYIGKWYQIASITGDRENQNDCVNTTAEYELIDGVNIGAVNSCEIRVLGVRLRRAITALAEPSSTQDGLAKFKLTLRPLGPYLPFGNKYTRGFPINAQYWILELDSDYKWAMVGTENKEGLYILSRTPKLAPEILEELIELASTKHNYLEPLDRLTYTVHRVQE